MSNGDDPIISFLLVCFDGHKTAAKHRRPLNNQLRQDGAELLDEVVLSVSPKRKVHGYDPRRTLAGALTPALTWGVFGLLTSDGSWASFLLWAVLGAVGGGLAAFYLEHTVSKTSLTRAGEQLPANSSALGLFVRSGDAETMLRSTVPFAASVASVAGIDADLSAQVWSGTSNPTEQTTPANASSPSPDDETLVSMVLLRFKGRDGAQRSWAEVTGGKVDKNASIQTELIIAADATGKMHVDSPSQGIRYMAREDIIGWGLFGVVFGFIAGWAGNGTLGGALERGVLTGVSWGIFGLGAGLLYGMWAGRAVSARRLKGIEALLPPDSSLLNAWVDGAATEDTVAAWSAPGTDRLILRFNAVEHGAVLET
jgi:uncharacterized membrane protein